ncbi:hypothetical protein V6N13_072063 [Hibiscus sabdariffa]|uniref:Uncharacterized protein n=1 Tax=Hibiscus sabdariffa TaxID=183260 RepID=A0ABR2TBP2_9ROSI
MLAVAYQRRQTREAMVEQRGYEERKRSNGVAKPKWFDESHNMVNDIARENQMILDSVDQDGDERWCKGNQIGFLTDPCNR